MKFILRSLIIFILFFSATFAQDEFTPGSPYTIFGIGDLRYSSSMRTDAMGIQGISLYGDYVNCLNPASNARLSHTYISGGFDFDMLSSSDGKLKTTVSDGYINGVNIGIPLNQNNGWVLNAGFNPISKKNYKITNTVTRNNLTYSQNYYGEGGITRINFGMSYIIFKFMSIGLEYNYAFGDIKKLTITEFNNAEFTNNYFRKDKNIGGSFVSGGIVIDAGKMTRSRMFKDLTLGFVYQSRLNLSTETEAVYGTSSSLDTVQIYEGDINVPESYGFGISGKIGRHIIVSSDILFQNWSKYRESNRGQEIFQNNFRFGIGIEYLPSDKADAPYFEQIRYRTGVSYEKSYYKVNDENINKMGISIGFGLPLSDKNSIDINASYFLRGKTENGLIKDEFLKISAGINFGELWFIRQREEDK